MKIPQSVLTEREFDLSYNVKEGVCKFNIHNSEEHEMAKALLMFRMMHNGHKMFSEVIFKGKKARADLVNATTGTIIELLSSEKIEDAKEKEKYYPASLMIQYYDAKDVLTKY